jgi:hypothetical protein
MALGIAVVISVVTLGEQALSPNIETMENNSVLLILEMAMSGENSEFYFVVKKQLNIE